jgi:hypothetical protein
MTLSLDSYPRPAPDVIGQLVEGEAVLVLPQRGEAKVLNSVAAIIWHMADGTRSVRDIAAAICAEYDVEREQAEADALAFVSELLQLDIFVLQQ